MAIVTIPDENQRLTDPDEIKQHLSSMGVEYERWAPSHDLPAGAPAEEILRAYAREIEQLKARGGYVTADVIDVNPETPGLDEMLAKFNREHWHDDDEVRFVVKGRGLFHIRPRQGPVMAIEVDAGDLIVVPRGAWHWFNLCADRQIRAIRLFQDPAGWTPRYTDTGVDRSYQPVCFGPAYIPPQNVATES